MTFPSCTLPFLTSVSFVCFGYSYIHSSHEQMKEVSHPLYQPFNSYTMVLEFRLFPFLQIKVPPVSANILFSSQPIVLCIILTSKFCGQNPIGSRTKAHADLRNIINSSITDNTINYSSCEWLLISPSVDISLLPHPTTMCPVIIYHYRYGHFYRQ